MINLNNLKKFLGNVLNGKQPRAFSIQAQRADISDRRFYSKNYNPDTEDWFQRTAYVEGLVQCKMNMLGKRHYVHLSTIDRTEWLNVIELPEITYGLSKLKIDALQKRRQDNPEDLIPYEVMSLICPPDKISKDIAFWTLEIIKDYEINDGQKEKMNTEIFDAELTKSVYKTIDFIYSKML